jgi:hypothetical protein
MPAPIRRTDDCPAAHPRARPAPGQADSDPLPPPRWPPRLRAPTPAPAARRRRVPCAAPAARKAVWPDRRHLGERAGQWQQAGAAPRRAAADPETKIRVFSRAGRPLTPLLWRNKRRVGRGASADLGGAGRAAPLPPDSTRPPGSVARPSRAASVARPAVTAKWFAGDKRPRCESGRQRPWRGVGRVLREEGEGSPSRGRSRPLLPGRGQAQAPAPGRARAPLVE